MSWISRRSFFRFLLSIAPVLTFPGRLYSRLRQELSDVQVRAIGRTILPTELGVHGQDRVTEGFRQWLRGFRPDPEMAAGWGSAEIPHGPPDPAERWSEQLTRLDQVSLQVHGVAFADLRQEARLSILRTEIREEFLPLRSPADAHHVAVGILSYFYRSPEATNLCYRAEIHSGSCRDLSTAGTKPDPLQSGF